MKDTKKIILLSSVAGGIVIILAAVLIMLNIGKPTLLYKDNPSISIDVFNSMYKQIKLSDYVNYGKYKDLSFSVAASDSKALTFSQIGKDSNDVIY